jgi:fluoride exporter
MRTFVAVAIGGALGSLARHGVNVGVAHVLGRSVPYATAAVNIVGSLVVGVLAGLIASNRLEMSAPVRAFVFVGILGGFTTFSTFMLDTLTLAHGGARTLAVSNVIGQAALGMLAVYLGYQVAVR